MTEPTSHNSPHDMGGLPAGPVDRSEHDLAFWERRVESLLTLCFRKGLLKDAAELRVGIESMGEEAYTSLSYYERWAASLTRRLTELGIVSTAEVEAKMAEIKDRYTEK